MTHKFITQWLLVIGTMLPLVACATGYPSHYSAEAISAKVIDAETKQPIEGVIVTANWQLLGGIEGLSPIGQMQVLETQTGPNGVFRFPAWGPLERSKGHLLNADPQLLLFKPGYEYRRLDNMLEAAWAKLREPLRRSDWSGRIIVLKPFRGAIADYEDKFESFNRELERIAADNPKECGWKKIPNTIRAMNRERSRLISEGANPNTLSSIDKRLLMSDEYFTKKGGCGSPKAFFEDLQK